MRERRSSAPAPSTRAPCRPSRTSWKRSAIERSAELARHRCGPRRGRTGAERGRTRGSSRSRRSASSQLRSPVIEPGERALVAEGEVACSKLLAEEAPEVAHELAREQAARTRRPPSAISSGEITSIAIALLADHACRPRRERGAAARVRPRSPGESRRPPVSRPYAHPLALALDPSEELAAGGASASAIERRGELVGEARRPSRSASSPSRSGASRRTGSARRAPPSAREATLLPARVGVGVAPDLVPRRSRSAGRSADGRRSRLGSCAVQRARRRDHAPQRLRAEQAAVRVPEVPGFGEARRSRGWLVGLGVAAAIEQPRREAARAGGRGEDEVQR